MSLSLIRELTRKRVKVGVKKQILAVSSKSSRKETASQIDISKLEINRRSKSPPNICNKSQIFIAKLIKKRTSNRIDRFSSQSRRVSNYSRNDKIVTPDFTPQNVMRYSSSPIRIKFTHPSINFTTQNKLPRVIRKTETSTMTDPIETKRINKLSKPRA